MALPQSFLEHLRVSGYHPRSDKHSKALAEAIIQDLLAYCPVIREHAAAGRLVYQFNHDLSYGHATWNTDLAIGAPPPGLVSGVPEPLGMRRSTPASTRIAVELKGVMTEHRKAIKNRKRDLEAHHAHVHDYDPAAIAAGVVVLNAATTFVSPLRGGAVTTHRLPDALIRHCMNEVNSITMASGSHRAGLDAKSAIVLKMDNAVWPSTTFLTEPPAPQVGSPVHWDAFIQRVCQVYTSRFS
jgi:hypothetical protein